jgi:hypothetical protein
MTPDVMLRARAWPSKMCRFATRAPERLTFRLAPHSLQGASSGRRVRTKIALCRRPWRVARFLLCSPSLALWCSPRARFRTSTSRQVAESFRLGPHRERPRHYVVRVVAADGHILEKHADLAFGQSVRLNFNIGSPAERTIPVTAPVPSVGPWNRSTHKPSVSHR